MTVAELIGKLQMFKPDMEVVTFADDDEAGNGKLHGLWESDVYDENGDETGEKAVYLNFYWEGTI